MSLSFIPSLVKNQFKFYSKAFPLDRKLFSFPADFDLENIEFLTDLSYIDHRFFKLTSTSKMQDNEIYKFSSDLVLSLYLCTLYKDIKGYNFAIQRCFMSLRCFMTYLNIYESDDIELFKSSKDYLNYLILEPFTNKDLIPVFFRLVQSLCYKFDKFFSSNFDLSSLSPNLQVQLYQLHKQKMALLQLAFSAYYNTVDKDFILTYIFDVKEFLDRNPTNIEKPKECPICIDNENTYRLDNCCHWLCEDCKTKCFECPYCKVPIYSLPAQRHVTITRNVFVIPEEHQNFFMFGK